MHRKVKQPMEITTTASSPFQKLFLDLVGPLPKTLQSNNYILTLQDDLTKYSIAVPIADATANTIARAFVQNFVCIYGIPDTILTDQGTNFMSDIFKHICKILSFKKLHTTAYHPQSNGALERSHLTLKNYIRSFVDKDQNNWDEYIIYAQFTYNTTIHTTTNFTPYELIFSKKPSIPTSFSKKEQPVYNYNDYTFELMQKIQRSREIAKENIIENKNKNKENYDKNVNQLKIHVGDKVLIKNQHPINTLSMKWLGPFEVIELNDKCNITIKKNKRKQKIHINNVKIFYE
jgi:hypothetical protein